MALPILSPLERLPNELKNMIFAAVSDVDSLVSAALSGRVLYESFQPDQALIIGKVLVNELKDLGIFEDAAAAIEARSFPRDHWTPERIREHFQPCALRRAQFIEHQSLFAALEIDRLHRMTRKLAKGVATKSMTVARKAFTSPEAVGEEAVSPHELARITRALYRFDLYCTFFGDHKLRRSLSQENQLELFWSHYAPWEIEQVACVMEYLQAEMLPVFEGLAMNDPEWTQIFALTDTLGYATEDFIQAQIAYGIEYVHRIIFGSGQDRAQGLKRPLDRDVLTYEENFLAVGLDGSVDFSEGWTLGDIEQDPEAREEAGHIIKPAFVEDGDVGPEHIWRWSHQEEVSSPEEEDGFVRSLACVELRECGYVFWDKTRLTDWDLMAKPFHGTTYNAVSSQRYSEQDLRRKMIDAKVEEFVASGRLQWFYY